jgi:hypothetical protein
MSDDHAPADGMWPHPLGDPCPLALDDHNREQARRDAANTAYIAKLDAERLLVTAAMETVTRDAADVLSRVLGVTRGG